MAVTKCKIRDFHIETASEGLEWAVIPLRNVTPEELRCILEAGKTEFTGPYHPGGFVPPNTPPRYRALTLSLEKQQANAQTH